MITRFSLSPWGPASNDVCREQADHHEYLARRWRALGHLLSADQKPAESQDAAAPTKRCTGCGARDERTEAYDCWWPDGAQTVESHCALCSGAWQRELRSLGVRFTKIASEAQE